jgi:para-nitrobenzyl esterase
MTGGGSQAVDLAHRMSDAWVRFARTGNPNGPGLPAWAPFTADRVPTMMFDTHCEVLNAPDAKEQAVVTRTT